jgi:formate dehydrogenase gamma subunit
MEKINKTIKRQSLTNRIIHWMVALSTFMLIFSGFGQMPMYKRYNVVNIPGLGWSGDYSITVILHYVFALILVFAVVYHLVYHLIRKDFDIIPRKGDIKESYQIIKAMLTGEKEPPSDKYLAEQRLAYAFIGVLLLAIVISGVVKVWKNLPGVEVSDSLVYLMTTIHNGATMLLILGIIGHLAAFIIKANRNLIPAMFSGKVQEEYVKERHSIWWKNIEKEKAEGREKIGG